MSAASVVVGATVPAQQRTITLTDMVAYAGATWDWHRLHYDPEYVASKQLPAPVVDGQLFGALLAKLVQDWLGPGAMLRRLSLRYSSPVYAGEQVRCTGTVIAVEQHPDGLMVTVDTQVEVVGDGRVAVAPATVDVLVRA